jgi:hypothetical protein
MAARGSNDGVLTTLKSFPFLFAPPFIKEMYELDNG